MKVLSIGQWRRRILPIGTDSQAPQTVDRYRTVAGALEQAFEFGMSVEGHDRAAAEVTDEQLIGMRAEVCRSDSQPRSIVNEAGTCSPESLFFLRRADSIKSC